MAFPKGWVWCEIGEHSSCIHSAEVKRRALRHAGDAGRHAAGIPKWQGWARDAKRKLGELMAADAESHGRKAG